MLQCFLNVCKDSVDTYNSVRCWSTVSHSTNPTSDIELLGYRLKVFIVLLYLDGKLYPDCSRVLNGSSINFLIDLEGQDHFL